MLIKFVPIILIMIFLLLVYVKWTIFDVNFLFVSIFITLSKFKKKHYVWKKTLNSKNWLLLIITNLNSTSSPANCGTRHQCSWGVAVRNICPRYTNAQDMPKGSMPTKSNRWYSPISPTCWIILSSTEEMSFVASELRLL